MPFLSTKIFYLAIFLIAMFAKIDCNQSIVTEQSSPFSRQITKQDCRGREDMECLDQRINELFVNINRFYSPYDGGYIDISYLNHWLYNSTKPFDKNHFDELIAEILSNKADQYKDHEIRVIKSFPNRPLFN
ncbi:hypothetical protein SSS_03103 [Sarcoptes scabiei]|uniref:Uncharacterized protein n=1 Tax=Sarcoptes scabiei TaxID=52283 RepID=A0A834VGM1_SARSC|nr:hypothetical protein SSS_03103 [Sarcoptes scabiei]